MISRLARVARFLAAATVTVGAGPGGAIALDYVASDVQAERAVPGVCLTFSAALPRGPADRLLPFVAVEPAGDTALAVRGKDLCVTGLAHGGEYRVRLHAGLPGQDGGTLAADATVEVRVPDRTPRVAFPGRGNLLPWKQGGGLPLESVNVERARLALYRIGERNLLGQLAEGGIGSRLTSWSAERLAERDGQLVFEGRADLATRRNQAVTTALPLEQMTGALVPGLYVAMAWPEGDQPEPWSERATQWFTVSDVGLFTVKGEDGLLVDARSLQTARSLDGVELRLLARNNELLATATTDAQGSARFAAGLLRGRDGAAPALLTATTARGDLTLVPLDRPGLDLVDLDVQGRALPGPLDAFLWSDRGVYRPGERAVIGALLRDAQARAVTGLPLTLALKRPDGIEVDRLVPTLGAAAGGTLTLDVPGNAYSGVWTVEARAGDGGAVVGRLDFVVEDFVPPRLEVAGRFDPPAPVAGEPIGVNVDARYLYGAPGGNLTGEAELLVRAAERPFPALEGFSFGLVQEPFLPEALPLASFATDEQGRARVELETVAAPDTMAPLEVVARLRVFDVDARPVAAETMAPYRSGDRFIGIRPRFTGDLPEQAEAGFDLRLVDGTGMAKGPGSLRWELVREDWDFVWFQADGRWDYERVVTESRIDGGEIAMAADGAAVLAMRVDSGRYRLEVAAADGAAASSVRFEAGFWADGGEQDRPETMPVTLLPDAAADTVRARIEPPFDARVLVMIAGSGVAAPVAVDVPKGGGVVELPAPALGPGGAYLLAVGFAPTGAVLPRLPSRALGAAWLPGPEQERRLEVVLEAPLTVRPVETATITLAVAGAAPGEAVYATVAAVDEAVLRLTGYLTPDPAAHYLGRRALGVELRDVWGRLIDPAGEPGRIVSGGDARAKLQLAGLDVRTTETVARSFGPLTLDADGRGQVALDVPEFSGRLRLMAVAWTAAKVGASERAMTVRPPLLAEVTLPRFLAPGDRADVQLLVTNLDAPEVTYAAELTTEGPLALDRARLTFRDVVKDRRRFAPLQLTAGDGTGAAAVRLKLADPEGRVVVDRRFPITVRPAQPNVTRRELRTVEAGQSLTFDSALATGLLPGTGRLDLTLSTVPAFDVLGLLAELDRYAYGCAEQTISRAFPRVFAGLLGPDPTAGRGEVEQAIRRLFSLEAPGGGFASWSPAAGAAGVWLTAYALDFLDRAAGRAVHVPQGLLDRSAAWLGRELAEAGETPDAVAAGAYAAWVLARQGRLDLSRARYLAIRAETRLPSEAAQAQLAAALAYLGDRELAARILARPTLPRPGRDVALDDFGSDLRDAALVLAVSAEAGLRPMPALLEQAQTVARRAAESRWLSTQEQAWLLRAAAALKSDAVVDLLVDGVPIGGSQRVERSIRLDPGAALAVRNQGQRPVYASWSVTGIPAQPEPAASRGFAISRALLTRAGAPLPPAPLRQTDQVVVLIEGRSTEPGFRQALIVDLLAAGIELEPVRLAGAASVEELAWLGELTEPAFVALRDDRFVAAVDVTPQAPGFRLAYLARAVTAGSFTLPSAFVEDMYAPDRHAHGPTARLEVVAR